MTVRLACLLLCVVGLVAPARAAAAPAILYGAQGGNFATSTLFTIDPATGATTVVGPLGQALTGLAYNPVDGVLYGVTSGNSACSRCLVRVNTTTGAATVIAALSGDGTIIAELAFASDGTLFGWNEDTDNLATIDLATGAVTVVGASGIGTYGDAMAFTGAGTLFVAPQGDGGPLYTVNTSTGAATVGATIVAPTTPRCVTGGSLSAGSVEPVTGTFYVSRLDNCGPGLPYPADLLTVDLATGTAVRIGALPAQTDAIEFVPQADVAVTKTAPATATAGGTISYGVTVANNGPDTAGGVSLSDAVPSGTTFVSATQTSGPAFTCTTPAVGGTGSVDCTIAQLAAGASAAFTIVVRSSASAANGSVVANTATVSAVTPDSDTANNTATASTTLATAVDVSVTKTVAPGTVEVGDTVRYVVTVTNAGPSNASAVTLVDQIPAGTTFVSASQASGPAFTCTTPSVGRSGTLRCTIPALASGASAVFDLAVRAGGLAVLRATLPNTASVSSSTADTNTANNTSTATSATLAARISLRAKARPRTIHAGEQVRFRILVRARRATAHGVRVCVRVPSGLVIVSAKGARVRNHRVCWTRRRLGTGRTRIFTVVARARPAARGRLTARVVVTGTGIRTVRRRATVVVLPPVPTTPVTVTG